MTSALTNVLASLTLALISAQASEWPNWRGPDFTGSTSTGDYPAKWSTNNIAWKVRLPGKGTSVPIVHKDRIYVTCPSEGQDAVLAFDFNGQKVWETKLGAESKPKHQTLASSANASPVTDGKLIYVYFKSGVFAAVDLDGDVKWKSNLVEQFGKENLFWDTGTSPMITDRHVVLARMHHGESWIAGFEKQTGDLHWKEARNFEVPNENDNGYTTPLLFENNGTKALLVWAADHLTAHDAATGKAIWTCGDFNPSATGYWPGISTPVIVGDIAVVPVGRDDRNQGSIEGIKLGGKGDVTKSHRAWKRSDTGVFVPTPAAYQGRVYLLRHKGEIVCLNPKDGQTVWKAQLPEHRSPYYASLAVANGILYAAREDGVVFTGRVTPEKFELLAENNLGERFVATPIAANDRLVLRGDNHLFCVKK